MTVHYEPDDETYRRFESRFGETVTLSVLGELYDNRGHAVWVEGFESEKKAPHITISCAPGTKPGYCESMCERKNIKDYPIKSVTGVLQFVKHAR